MERLMEAYNFGKNVIDEMKINNEPVPGAVYDRLLELADRIIKQYNEEKEVG